MRSLRGLTQPRGHCSRSILHQARRGHSVGGAHTTLPATYTALADRRSHGAGGGHFGEQEPSSAVTGLTTHRDRLGRGTHTTFPTPDRTAPRERLYRAWSRLLGHVRCSAAVTGITTHGHRRELRDLEAYVRLWLSLLAPLCLLRQCRHGQHQDQPGERPLDLPLLPLHNYPPLMFLQI